MQPFLCIITPVFDPALNCIQLLVEALKKQSCQDFIHVSISNGESSQIKNYLEKQDSKFIYDELPLEPVDEIRELLANLGLRRNYCLKKYNADRYLFLDADIKLLDIDYFSKLKEAHHKADILLTQVKCKTWHYPIFPIELGRIDIANYSFSQKIAKKYAYPSDFSTYYICANDYRFFENLLNNQVPFHFLPFVSAEKDGNNNESYKRVSEHRIK